MTRFSGLTSEQVQAIPSLHFDQSMMAIEAARHGQGVVLSSALLTERETTDGLLFEPFAARLELPKAYYIVHPKDITLRPAVAALKTWLLSLTRERDLPDPRSDPSQRPSH